MSDLNVNTTGSMSGNQNPDNKNKKNQNPDNKAPEQETPVQGNEGDIVAAEKSIAAFLAKQPKVTVRIPLKMGDLPVCINGHTFNVKAGEEVPVPKDVAALVKTYLDSAEM